MVNRFSGKQKQVLSWWLPGKKEAKKPALICDGAVRSGKTFSGFLSFLFWSLWAFRESNFALCGKTRLAVRRNVVEPALPILKEMGFLVKESRSDSFLSIGLAGQKNRYYLFGGKDEAAGGHIQGMTLGGVFFDEAALMPRSFVEQAMARCSLKGSKFWFNCNPEGPQHWFYKEWIAGEKRKNACYFHFNMEDNPSLSKEVRQRYESLYSGIFYDRFVRGKWVAAQGLVYPLFSSDMVLEKPPAKMEDFVISCDYGTVNPTSFGLWGKVGQTWYRIKESYYDSRRQGVCRTDEEHYRALKDLAGNDPVSRVVVDPSAASFLELIRRKGEFFVIPAENAVADGIRRVASALQSGRIMIGASCCDSLREFSLYRWSPQALGERVLKENDHAMDDIRYFVSTILYPKEAPFFVGSVERDREI